MSFIAVTMRAVTLPPPRNAGSEVSKRTIALSARLAVPTVGLMSLMVASTTRFGAAGVKKRTFRPGWMRSAILSGSSSCARSTRVPTIEKSRSPTFTKSPLATAWRSISPSIGASTRALPMLRRVWSPRAFAAASWSRWALRCAVASSTAFCEMKPFSIRRVWRSTTRSACSSSVDSRAMSAVSARAWISKSCGSISASNSPFFTFLPVCASTRITRPATSAPSFGSMTFSRAPTTSS